VQKDVRNRHLIGAKFRFLTTRRVAIATRDIASSEAREDGEKHEKHEKLRTGPDGGCHTQQVCVHLRDRECWGVYDHEHERQGRWPSAVSREPYIIQCAR
jgi:hypothetical protein